MGRSEAIGSGVRNLYKYTPLYSEGGQPVLFEADVFRIEIPLTRQAASEQKEKTELSERERTINEAILKNRSITVDEMALMLNVSRRTILRDLKSLKKKRRLSFSKSSSIWILS